MQPSRVATALLMTKTFSATKKMRTTGSSSTIPCPNLRRSALSPRYFLVQNYLSRYFIGSFLAPQVKIRRSERKLRKEDYDLILENAGIKISKKEDPPKWKKRAAGAGGAASKKKKGYRDSDDDDIDSQEENFIATSSEDEKDDEKSACEVQAKIQKYVKSSGETCAPLIFLTFSSYDRSHRRHLAHQDIINVVVQACARSRGTGLAPCGAPTGPAPGWHVVRLV